MLKWTGLMTGLTLCLMASTDVSGASTTGLEQFRWKNRVLVVFADRTGAMANEQVERLKRVNPGATERDMVLVLIKGNAVQTFPTARASLDASALRTRLNGPDDGSFEVLLIGKDGGIKLRDTKPVATDALFTLIDTMPMRSNETRK
ncbi:DUF4174 domain-containing protein [Rhizobium sp. CFBP 8762]|uniref:DUF4174 domain-containing protein n=1 Tax=Rhizobium sp. CFBP 8762 TaxID=2775279 RepID=UPI001786DABE|nr:DUF4174 domain-containing protein [Rhizobium sp. CFBP 8762]MBD8553052.1 DUF4174 domain-containing protein [Rhizobium sp. CFBP 8762]